jgi:hypothetical protein
LRSIQLLEETEYHRPNGGDPMKLISRHRNQYRAVASRIAISQAEITADLHYPVGSRRSRQAPVAARRGGGR